MNNVIYVINICKYRVFNRKYLGILIFMGFIYFIFLSPVKRICNLTGYNVSPWGFPFLLCNVFFATVYWGCAVYWFSDVPFKEREMMYHYARLGKLRWGVFQLIQILIRSFIFVITNFLLSILVLLPNLCMEMDWGEIYYTIALTDTNIKYNLLFEVPYKIISHYSVVEAIVFSMVSCFLCTLFLGYIMYMTSLFTSHTVAVFIGELHVITPLVSDNLAKITPEVRFFSPSAWIQITNIGYEYNYTCPSMWFVFGILGTGIVITGVICLLKVLRKKKNVDNKRFKKEFWRKYSTAKH